MNIILMRHAIREHADMEKEAALTPEGQRKARETAIQLREHFTSSSKEPPDGIRQESLCDLILHSNMKPSQDTAVQLAFANIGARDLAQPQGGPGAKDALQRLQALDVLDPHKKFDWAAIREEVEEKGHAPKQG